MTNQDLDQLVAQAIQRIQDESPLPLTYQDPAAIPVDTLASYIDHTLLKPDATADQIDALCRDAVQYGFASVCVHPTWTTHCQSAVAGSDVAVCTVAGFPHGSTLPAVKAYEAAQAMHLGAAEVDMVLNVGRLKNGDYDIVYEDIASVAQVAHVGNVLVKVIIETALLTREERIAASVLVQAAGADFVKTATGFNGGGATVEDVALMRAVVGPTMGIKAAGGVRTADDARQMIAAGATRIGTSAGVQIVTSSTKNPKPRKKQARGEAY